MSRWYRKASDKFIFLVEVGHLSSREHLRRESIAQAAGCAWASLTEACGTEWSWFIADRKGEPFDSWLSNEIAAMLQRAEARDAAPRRQKG